MNNFYKLKYLKPGNLQRGCKQYTLCLLLLLFSAASVFAQQKTVSGVVKDSKGETLPGVSVLLKGTSTGAVTAVDGKYRVRVNGPESVLVFSFIGFGTQEITVGQRSELNVTMSDNATSLNEVVVVGYGEQKKSTLTGSISTVSSKELVKSPASNVTNSLVGRLSGLSAVQRSGQPGNNVATINIRGAASYNNTSAIIIVDGIERASFGDIDANEIETISILKDASSTAIFGIRGANGVIIITTKAGKEGKPRISYSGNASIQTYTGIPKSLDAYNNTMLINEANRNDGLAETWGADELQKFKDGSDPYGYPDVKWFDYVTRKYYPQTQHNLNVSGGTKMVKYFASIGYLYEDGIFKEFDSPYGYRTTPSYNRYNFRSNLDLNLSKNLLVNVRLGGRLGRRYQPAGLASSSGSFSYDNVEAMISRILQTPSFAYPVMLADGRIAQNPDVGTNIWNPYAVLTRWGTRNDDNNTIESTFNINYKLDGITKGLSFKGVFGYDSYYTSTTKRNATWAAYKYDRRTGDVSLTADRFEDEPLGTLNATSSGNINSNIQVGFNYSRSFGQHNVNGVALATRQLRQVEGEGLNAAPRASQGLVNRVTYNYSEKYFLEFNAAYNGSENFAPGLQYGFFPAGSIGWTVTKEDFMKGLSWLNYLKIRGSYGKVGSDALDSRFGFLTNYQVVSGGVTFGLPSSTVSTPVVNVELNGNPLLTWETAIKRNVGFESRFLKERLQLNVDLFDEHRDGILTPRQSGLAYYGIGYPALNVGKVYNKGYEIELNWLDRAGDFTYGINTNYSFARNKILNKDEPVGTPEYLKQKGKRIGQFFGFTTDGFYQSQEEINSSTPNSMGKNIPGDLKYKDYNQDGVLSTDDMSPIGYSRTPEINYGISPSVSWKNLSLSVLLQGVAHVSSDVILSEQNNGQQMYEFQLGRWTPETAATATWPALHSRGNTYLNYRLNDFILQDASYLKLRNVELSYTFPKKWLSVLKVNSLRVFFQGQNLHTWTKFKMYLDPENINLSNTDFSKQSVYPTPRIYNFGVNLQL